MKRILVILSIIFLFCTGSAAAFDLSQFKIQWKYGSTFGILFDQSLTDDQLEEIINDFSIVRKENRFRHYFSPTTLNFRDKFYSIQIIIFTEPEWATLAAYRKYLDGSTEDSGQEYLDNIRGFYSWQTNAIEKGTIGMEDDGLRSSNYQVIFSRPASDAEEKAP
jgi:hypothetical protein